MYGSGQYSTGHTDFVTWTFSRPMKIPFELKLESIERKRTIFLAVP